MVQYMDIYEKINNLIARLERSKNKTISQKAILNDLELVAELFLQLKCVTEKDKLIGNELWKLSQGYRQSKKKIKKALVSIKKILSEYGTKKKLKNPDLIPGKILFFTAGENYSAYDHLKNIFAAAKNNIDIIDPYLYPQTFSILKCVNKKLKIRLISNSNGFYNDSKTDFNNFKKEYSLESRGSQVIHDRFFVIDDRGYFSGSSLHNVGNKLSAIAIMDNGDTKKFQTKFNELWNKSKIL